MAKTSRLRSIFTAMAVGVSTFFMPTSHASAQQTQTTQTTPNYLNPNFPGIFNNDTRMSLIFMLGRIDRVNQTEHVISEENMQDMRRRVINTLDAANGVAPVHIDGTYLTPSVDMNSPLVRQIACLSGYTYDVVQELAGPLWGGALAYLENEQLSGTSYRPNIRAQFAELDAVAMATSIRPTASNPLGCPVPPPLAHK